MIDKTELETELATQQFKNYKPIDRDSLLNVHLTLLIVEAINALQKEVAGLNEKLEHKYAEKSDSKPGPKAKKLDTKTEVKVE